MGLVSSLTEQERDLVKQCLHAAVQGPFFPEWEFHTLMGLKRAEIAEVLSRWPVVDSSDELVCLAVSNSLTNLLGYPHGCERHWSKFIHASPSDVAHVLAKWRETC